MFVLTLMAPAAPAAVDTAQDAPQAAGVILVQDGEEEGFFGKYFPFGFRDPMTEAGDNIVVPYYLSILFLPFGWLWAPYVFGDEKPGPDFVIDALIVLLVHLPVSFCTFPLLFIPILGWAAWLAINLTNSLYLMPVGFINAYDRSIADGGGGGGKFDDEYDDYEDEKPKRRKRRRRRESAAPMVPQTAMAF